MLAWEPPVFDHPFELWRDDDVLHLVLADGARLTTRVMKEMVRLVAAMDASGTMPVLIDHSPGVSVEDDARALLVRVCREHGHPVAVYSANRACRDQLLLFKQTQRPRFPLRVFESRQEAWRWVRECKQLQLVRMAVRSRL